jgi:hypothetical protein
MARSDSQLARLHRLLDSEPDESGWLGDQASREALSAQWLLARDIPQRSRKKFVQNLEDLTESERRVRSDHAGRYPIELLQNAHDACADAGLRGKAWFRVTPSALLVANQGVPFNAERIQSLIRLGGSSKTPGDAKHHTIGYKGIGFTSVFEISDTPQIISRRVAFGLDSGLAVQELRSILDVPVTRAPARYFPFPASQDDWHDDAEHVDALLADGAVTVVRLPFRDSVDSEAVTRRIRETLQPTTLLLMPALDEMDLGAAMHWTRRRSRKLFGGQLHTLSTKSETATWLVVDKRVPASTEVIGALEDPVWAGVRDLQVLVGIPWNRGRPDDGHGVDLRVHAYFPTDDSIGRRFLAHGDFFLESNRRHVQGSGPGGEVSRAVARGLVDVVGDLAETIAREAPAIAPALIACLAEADEPQGYGRVIAQILDEELAKRPILRSITGDTIAPREARILGGDIPPREAADLCIMLHAVPELADPAYERAAADYLVKLGAKLIPATEVARKLDARAAPTYDRAILATSAWWQGTHRLWTDKAALALLRLLMGTDGEWHVASELCEPVPGVPPLPPGLERATYRPPRSREAAEFLRDQLPITTLDLTHSLEIVLTALKTRRYGLDHKQRRAAHDFVLAAFRYRKASVRSHPDRGVVPVPTRTWRRGGTVEWRPASQTYFSREWNGHADLEKLYRRFSGREFLAVEPPKSKRSRQLLRDYYVTLGVASEPRFVPKVGRLWFAPDGWKDLEEVEDAAACPDGHPQTGREFETAAFDRLEDILADITSDEARALVSILGRSEAPYGPAAKIWCTHSQHRRSVKRSAIGLQRWLLQSHSWVPVHGDPAGRQLVSPAEAWTDVNGRALQAVLPQAEVPRATAGKLDLPSATHGDPRAIVSALLSVRDVLADLNAAPQDAVEGAFHLLQKLESALHRSKRKLISAPTAWLPAYRDGLPRWSGRPAVQDIRVPPSVPFDVLPFGDWSETARWLSLPNASESVAVHTTAKNGSLATLAGLEFEDKVNLVALLAAKGADLKNVARRLGRLDVKRCDEITTSFRMEGYEEAEARLAHVDEDVGAATLYVVDPIDDDGRAEIAHLLAEYTGGSRYREAILLYLVGGAGVLLAFNVRGAALDEARAAIGRYRREEVEVLTSPSVEDAGSVEQERTSEAAQPTEGRGAGTRGAPTAGRPNIRTVYSAPVNAGPVDEVPNLGNVSFVEGSGSVPSEPQGNRPTGARGGTGSSGHATVSSATRRAVELKAIEVAKKFGRERYHCVEVRDVQEENKGWDLEFVTGDRWWPVEVKGFAAGASAFILSRNELRAAMDHGDYCILVVTGMGAGAGEVIEFLNPRSWLSEEQLEPMSWSVTKWAERPLRRFAWSSDT